MIGIYQNKIGNYQGKIGMILPPIDGSGGIVTYDGNYRIHTFTSSGTFQMIHSGDVSTLLLGNGGNGGSQAGGGGYIHSGGGGGAAGICIQANNNLITGLYSVNLSGTVSFNGQNATSGSNGNNGYWHLGFPDGLYYGGSGGNNEAYIGSNSGGAAELGGGGAGSSSNAGGQTGGNGIASSISGSSIVYGKGGNGGNSGVNGENSPVGIVIIRYKYK